jgi:hypothetical protein
MSDLALRLLFWFLGLCIAQGSRYVPSLRAQITRSLTVELSAGPRVARHWVFQAGRRCATTRAGRAETAECRVHFSTSLQALRILTSPRAVDRIVGGFHDGSVTIQGSAFLLLWFYGLTRIFVKIGRGGRPRRRIPGAYLAHDPAACGAEAIVVEPAVQRLDPEWKAAWKARSTLPIIRVCTDEYFGEP